MRLTKYSTKNFLQTLSMESKESKQWLKMKNSEAEKHINRSKLGRTMHCAFSPATNKYNLRRNQLSPLQRSKHQLRNLPAVPDKHPAIVSVENFNQMTTRSNFAKNVTPGFANAQLSNMLNKQ